MTIFYIISIVINILAMISLASVYYATMKQNKILNTEVDALYEIIEAIRQKYVSRETSDNDLTQ